MKWLDTLIIAFFIACAVVFFANYAHADYESTRVMWMLDGDKWCQYRKLGNGQWTNTGRCKPAQERTRGNS